MTLLTALYGAFLTAIGLFAYFIISSESITALIPAFFGIPILIIAAIQANGQIVRTGLIIAVILAAIGFIATIPSLLKLPALLNETDIPRPEATIIQISMSILSLLYLVPALGALFKRQSAQPGESP